MPVVRILRDVRTLGPRLLTVARAVCDLTVGKSTSIISFGAIARLGRHPLGGSRRPANLGSAMAVVPPSRCFDSDSTYMVRRRRADATKFALCRPISPSRRPSLSSSVGKASSRPFAPSHKPDVFLDRPAAHRTVMAWSNGVGRLKRPCGRRAGVGRREGRMAASEPGRSASLIQRPLTAQPNVPGRKYRCVSGRFARAWRLAPPDQRRPGVPVRKTASQFFGCF